MIDVFNSSDCVDLQLKLNALMYKEKLKAHDHEVSGDRNAM